MFQSGQENTLYKNLCERYDTTENIGLKNNKIEKPPQNNTTKQANKITTEKKKKPIREYGV